MIAAKSDEIGCKAHQLGKGAKRLIEQVKTHLVACFARLEIALIALCISRVVLIYLAQIFGFFAGIVEDTTIVKTYTVKRIHQSKINIVAHGFAAKCPKLLKKLGNCDNGWAAVKRKPVLPIGVSAAAKCVEFLEQRDVVSLSSEAYS